MPKQVIFLMTDGTRRDMLSCEGDERMHTPNLDRLAAEGIRFENAYTCQPVCGPARSAIFTGTFPHSNGMVTNCVPLGANVKTLGQRLTDRGIACGYIGKWHLDGGDYFGLGKCPEGWDPDYWYDMKCYLEEFPDEDRKRSRIPGTCLEDGFSEEFTYAHRVANRAIRYLEEFRDRDFFLSVSMDEPHGPSLCPAPYNTMFNGFRFRDTENYSDDLSDKPLLQRLWAGKDLEKTPEELNHPDPLYLGSNSFADHELGRVIDRINELMPDALVIYTSDHGDMFGSHRLHSKNASAYREVANIPLIVRGGAKGRILREPASHIDIAPTVLDYFGLPVPKLLEGRSILPRIMDPDSEAGKACVNEEVYLEFTRYEIDHDGFGGLQMMRAAVSNRFKLVINLLDRDEFYDLKEDPAEMHNLINDPAYTAERNALHDRLLEHMNATRDLYRGYQWSARPWRPDRQPCWENDACTRQRENEEYEPRQLDYDTGLPMEEAIRHKKL